MLSDSCLQAYTDRVASGDLYFDIHQMQTLKVMETSQKNIFGHRTLTTKICRFLKDESYVGGFYLWGGVGTGKTLLMDLFHNTCPKESSYRVHFHSFIKHVHKQKSELKNKKNPLDLLAKNWSRRFRVLCLDELWVMDIVDAMLLSQLIKSLFKYNIFLVVTANCAIKDIYLGGIQRDQFLPTIRLLQEKTVEQKVDGGVDYRLNNHHFDRYLHGMSASYVDDFFMNFFNRKELVVGIRPKAIKVSGRDILVKDIRDKIIWVSFLSLCQSHRSRMDYLELVKKFNLFLIDGIPVMKKNMEDSTRRFIELIDTLYDAKVKCFFAAEAPPHLLYQGLALKAPFQRTQSRLMEMSGESYNRKKPNK